MFSFYHRIRRANFCVQKLTMVQCATTFPRMQDRLENGTMIHIKLALD